MTIHPTECKQVFEIYGAPFRKIYRDLSIYGKECSPRGMKIKEIEDYSFKLDPYVRFTSFDARKMSIDYIKKELKWYLRGNRYDLSICDHAKIWKDMITEAPGQESTPFINSNYGWYIFNQRSGHPGFKWVIEELVRDKDSRRASITILGSEKEHLIYYSKDVPCNYAINFRIRNNYLNMSVHARSMDAIYGMTNDVPFFSFVQEFVFTYLKEYYPTLMMGTYNHAIDSFHVYERHFEMLNKLVDSNCESFKYVDVPMIGSKEEADSLIGYGQLNMDLPFTKWLHE